MPSKKLRKILVILALLVMLLTLLWFLQDREKLILDDTSRASLPGQFVRLPQGVVHYELAGPQGASLVVLVHGFSVPYYVWDPTFNALTNAGYRVLRYDLYGRGYSDRPEAEYNLELFTGQLEGLLDALDIEEPVSLVGLSFGGPLVAHYANLHPGQVRNVVLIDPQVAPVAPGELFPLTVPLVGEYLMRVYMVPVMFPESQANDFYEAERFPNWETQYRDQIQYQGFRRAILSTIRNMPQLNPPGEYTRLGQTGLPVMLLWGREDQTISAENIGTIRRAISGVEYHIVEEAGHLPHYEQPETVNPLLIAFLGRRSGQNNQDNWKNFVMRLSVRTLPSYKCLCYTSR